MKILAIDIGASSGRFIVCGYNCGSFSFEETYRFPNGAVVRDNRLYWNIDSLFDHIKKGLKITLNEHNDISSIGIDTWGCDYVLIKDNKKVSDPFAYRDIRNEKTLKEFLKDHSYEEIYAETGIQKLPFNTIFQLKDDVNRGVDFDTFLMIPDYLNFLLTGNKYIELTNISTGAIYNSNTREISKPILDYIGINKKKISPMIYPSNLVGEIKDELVEELGIYKLPVISTGSHDTASAVASASLKDDSAYLSSGTWSLLGIELKEPLMSEESYKLNFSNEIGLEHTVRFLKNIMGLFIIQEIRKDLLANNPNLTFGEMQEAASKVLYNNIYIDVNDDLFQRPNDMLNKLYQYLKNTNQYTGELSIGQITRIVYESMAFKYKEELSNLERITNKTFNELVIIGGGSNAKCLNQIVSNVLNIKVSLGDKEATVVGNMMSQMIYFKTFENLKEARITFNKTLQRESYSPENVGEYINKYQRYLEVTK